ncbi:aspartate kinase [uncultured Imperialibacter sp.]|uniref:aspartate kinase n=1 Tax=uncultured Imperialibacter sp. TaxID=1672639 RepID=UPI0030D9FB42|tara:strand:+ start:9611 stop:10930 length:1320 start_codon:yes stop_codon:yes gene_type:complete
MIVVKFGGTSVGKPERMHSVKDIVMSVPGQKLVVLSAVSGTTNELIAISDEFSNGNIEGALDRTRKLYAQYVDFVQQLYATEEGKQKGTDVIDRYFQQIETLVKQPFYGKANKLLVAQGEIISTSLFYEYLNEIKVPAVFLSALDFMYLKDNGEPDLDLISEKLRKILAGIDNKSVIVTQGYICRNASGGVDNLKRGGSDYTATLIGAAIKAEEVQIWTDIDGMHNNDPRIVENTMPIAELSFEEAGELAYFGAKILHPTCILPAQQKNVPVRLKNTLNPAARGTLITSNKNPDAIKAIAVKDGITAIKIKSTRMILAYGFLRKIFEVFEKYQTSIDMITTSEVAVSLTIDEPTYLNEIIEELKPYGTIEVDKNQSIVCIVGDFVADKKGVGKDIFASLEDIPVRMISYGGSKNNISLLIDTIYKTEALKVLNKGLFNL